MALAEGKKGKTTPFIPLSELKAGSFAANPTLENEFFLWAQAIESGDYVESANHGAKILDIQISLGSTNIIAAADFALSAGRKALRAFDYDSAFMAGQLAIQLAPDYPAGHFFLGNVKFNQDKKDINNIFPHYINGIKATLENKLERAAFIASFVKYFTLAIVLAFTLSFGVLLYGHRTALFSDLSSFIPGGVDPKFKVILGVLAVLAPLGAGGFTIFAMALPLFIMPYLHKNEKMLIGVFAMMLLAAPLAFQQMAKSTIVHSDGTYRAMYLLSLSSWDYESKIELEKAAKANPNDELLLYGAGNMYKLSKDKDNAIDAYDALLKIDPSNIRAMVNKGNVYFQSREYEDASKVYDQSTKIDPNSVEAVYNLSVAYTEMLQNEKSTMAYEKALALNTKKTNSFAQITAGHPETPEKKVISFAVNQSDLAKFERRLDERVSALSESLWASYFSNLSLEMYKKISMLYILIALGVFLFWERARISHQTCSSCGTPFHPPMRLELRIPKCNQCVAAQSSKTVVSSMKKDQKKKQIREFKDKIANQANLMDRVFPGLGRVFMHNPIEGIFLVTVSMLVLLYTVSIVLGDLTGGGVPAEAIKKHLPVIGGAGVYWLIMNTAFFKEN